MKFGRIALLTALAALAGCTATAPDAGDAGAAAARPIAAAPSIYVMRHLQRGDGPDPALSAEGRANAGRLAAALAADPPSAIWVSTTRRARETAAPLAAALGRTPREYDPRDTPGLIAAVAKEPGSVLVVGHSNTVADIVARLGGARPAELAESDYGQIWRIDRQSGETTSRRLGE